MNHIPVGFLPMSNTKSKFTYKGEEVSIITDFDNGALARVEEKETNIFDCWPYHPPEEFRALMASFAFHFRLDGCRNKKVSFRFHVKEREKEEDPSIVYANPDFPVYSYDEINWKRAENKSLHHDPTMEYGEIIFVEEKFLKNRVQIAYQYPYSNGHLYDYIDKIRASAFCEIEVAGRSTEGREIRQITITDSNVPLREKKVIWLTGLQHPAEMGAGWGMEGMIDFLLSKDTMASEAREKYVFKFIPIVNVDSVAEGRGTEHSSKRNPNREWERTDPIPEIGSIKRTLDEWKARGNAIDIFSDIHGFSSKDGRWYLVLLPEESYSDKQRAEYKRLIEVIKKNIPSADSGPNPSVGYAAGAGCRRYGALSLSIDGWVYPWLVEGGKPPDLSSRYKSSNKVCSLESIKAAGATFVKAFVEFSKTE